MPYRKNLSLLLIMGVPLLLMSLSYGLHFLNESEVVNIDSLLGTKTVGDLVEPAIPIRSLTLRPLLPDKTIPLALHTSWRLFVVSKENCLTCDENLLESRQMHVALGKHANKLQRYHLVIDDLFTSEKINRLKSAHPKLEHVFINQENFNALPEQIKNSDYFLVDTRGWIMMSYPKDTEEKAMMSDLKHLFKYAQ